MTIIVQSRERKKRIKIKDVRSWAKKVLEQLGIRRGELSVLLVDDDEIRQLNLKYLGRDRPTNVMAFPMDGPDPKILGDVVISTETAQRESQELGIGTEEYIALLLIHGILHLLGYDHERDEEEALRMQQKEGELLGLLFSGP